MAAESEEQHAEHANATAELNGNGEIAKKTKADKRKEKKKKQKESKQQRRQQQQQQQQGRQANGISPSEQGSQQASDEDVIIEYVSAPIDLELSQPEQEPEDIEEHMGLGLAAAGGLGFSKPKVEDPFADLKRVFEKFVSAEELTAGTTGTEKEEEEETRKGEKEKAKPKQEDKSGSESEDEDAEDGSKKKLSKKQRKLQTRVRIAELKQLCERPDVVEVWDVTAADPQLLVFLKAYRNTVAVPRHWSQKRKYLQGKRGIEKPPFKLPDFIEATGIGEMRQAYQEKEAAKKLKQKQRERMAPKMGRMDIDYQVLHDAFFKYQTRPQLTGMGELYYEGKEFEARVDSVKPGVLSDDLKKALGMSDGAPPPWLINMQRYGPPPSYPNLKVPGLNAPIPPGASFGYHPGGWGKPPVDEEGNPLYGDVFAQHDDRNESDAEVDKGQRWGELEVEVEESEEEEEEEEEEEQMEEQEMAEGIASGLASGMVSGLASGISSSLPSGIETPDMMVNLRKGNESEAPRQAYTVLEQRQVPIGQTGLMGTDHVYVIPGADQRKDKKRPGMLGATDVEVALTPEEMEGLDEAGLKALYEQKVAEQRAANKREDFSDMVAAKAAQQKRKAAQKLETKAAKKQKDFKF